MAGVTEVMDAESMGSLTTNWVPQADAYGDPGIGAFEGIAITPNVEHKRISNLFKVVGSKLVTIWEWVCRAEPRIRQNEKRSVRCIRED